MPEYRRAFRPGGTFFFTVVTYDRAPILCEAPARAMLREAIDECRVTRPFTIDAWVLLPDHLHAIWTLPDGDHDFSARWSTIKRLFTQSWLGDSNRERPTSASRRANRRRGVWQRRFWEHAIRDQRDLSNHLNYLHYNPVKHGLTGCPHAWPHSTFHRLVREDLYARDWCCMCGDIKPTVPNFHSLNSTAME